MHEELARRRAIMGTGRPVITECCIFRYDNMWRTYWDLLIIIFAIFNCVVMPLQVAFPGLAWMNNNVSYTVSERITDVAFFCDIIINFRTTFINQKSGVEAVESKRIAFNYVFRGRFWIDLLASIPFELIYPLFVNTQEDTDTQLRLLGLLKLVRLFRLGRIVTFMKVRQSFKLGFRIFQLLFFFIMLVHWVGCMYFVMVIDTEQWLPPFDLNNQETEFYSFSYVVQYEVVFYYAVIMTVGNELAPVTLYQTVYCSMIIIAGSLILAFVFGSIAAVVAAMNRTETTFADQLDRIQNELKAIKLPEKIQLEVIRYFETVQENPNFNRHNISKFYHLLSPFLKVKILTKNNEQIFNNIIHFNDCSEAEIAFIATHLEFAIYSNREVVLHQGEKGTHIYFILEGKAEVFQNREIPLTKIKQIDGYEHYRQAIEYPSNTLTALSDIKNLNK